MSKDIIMIGVDPGSKQTGYGIIEYKVDEGLYRYIDSGIIVPSAELLSDRLSYLFHEMIGVINRWKDLQKHLVVAQERYYSGRLYGGDVIGKACGVLQLAAHEAEADEFIEVNKKTANKIVVGRGGSKKNKVTKKDIQEAVKRKLNINKDMEWDESDAIAIALAAIIAHMSDKKLALSATSKTQGKISK